jgi:alpha-amylase
MRFVLLCTTLAAILQQVKSIAGKDLPGCDIYSENQCVGDQINTDAKYDDYRWFTPKKGDPDYLNSFQDFSELVAFSTVQYSEDRSSATIHVTTTQKKNGTLSYSFNGGKPQSSNEFKISKGDSTRSSLEQRKGDTTEEVSVTVTSSLGYSISLEPEALAWSAPSVIESFTAGDYRSGQKGAIVEMFGWPHTAVEKECVFLAEAGYMGVKVFPPQEHIMSTEPFNGIMNPWYFFYQPVSYRMAGRMGTRAELQSMIRTCRSHGVRVYADAVVNHMSGGGNDGNPKHRNPAASCQEFGAKQTSAADSLGQAPMYTQDYVYSTSDATGYPPSQEFPTAGYGPLDFHCERPLNSWNDPLQLNAGWLNGLTDLNTERDYVQERIAAYMTSLIGLGFSGFRVDAAKHIQPDDLVLIFGKLKRNLGGSLPADFITWLEVLLGGEKDMLMCDVDSGYNYGGYLETQLLSAGFSQADVNKIKIWNSGYPKEPDAGACSISKVLILHTSCFPKKHEHLRPILTLCHIKFSFFSFLLSSFFFPHPLSSTFSRQVRNAIQNDDADQQNPGSTSRDMGDQGCVLIKDCGSADEHRGFETKLFSSPNGASDNANEYPIRLILSSFYWPDGVEGIPDGLSDCKLCKTQCDGCKGVTYAAAFDADSTGYDGPASPYTRPHRDKDIITAMQQWLKN